MPLPDKFRGDIQVFINSEGVSCAMIFFDEVDKKAGSKAGTMFQAENPADAVDGLIREFREEKLTPRSKPVPLEYKSRQFKEAI